MTVNVEALIGSFGKSYKEIHESGLLPYKTMPSATSGDPNLSLVMAKEGIYLSFKRDDLTFQEMTLRIQYDKVKSWVFPNELPFPLQKSMSRQWVHKNIGEPENSIPPRVIMKQEIGWVERFSLRGLHIPVTMQIRYDMYEMVVAVTYLPTSELRW
ncbi:hypothetical protein PEC302107_41090 [Pectobacterium araliae]|uniref:DUF6392 family protein n=1 Tax=Pectobacterium araliae TaxID=3073862 RepID=A0AAN0MKN6_9GAMM|nr:DUF6392 family protein [Pectobacterium sp. MAFF 302110]GKW22380.1 hypothetical protein PEC302107_41090 [Pectobacterium carotovorum subsp. carotovorum]